MFRALAIYIFKVLSYFNFGKAIPEAWEFYLKDAIHISIIIQPCTEAITVD